MVCLALWKLFADISDVPIPADRKTQLLYGAVAASGILVLMLLIVWLRAERNPHTPRATLSRTWASCRRRGREGAIINCWS